MMMCIVPVSLCVASTLMMAQRGSPFIQWLIELSGLCWSRVVLPEHCNQNAALVSQVSALLHFLNLASIVKNLEKQPQPGKIWECQVLLIFGVSVWYLFYCD